MQEPVISLDTALRPPPEVIKEAMLSSRQLADVAEAYFVLDGKEFHPHLTLYFAQYPLRNRDKVFEGVADVARLYPEKITCTLQEIEASAGYVIVKFALTSPVQALHEALVERLNPLREGHIFEKHKDDPAWQEYGYPNIFEKYSLHLTLTRLKDPIKAQELVQKVAWSVTQFEASSIGVFLMGGSHGTCKELLYEYPMR